jgi:hypothetical protein
VVIIEGRNHRRSTCDLTKAVVVMLRKPDHHLGALPISRKRVSCDFSGMRGARSRPVTIRHLPAPGRAFSQGFSLAIPRDLSRRARRKNPIRSYSMEKLRGKLNGTQVRKQHSLQNSHRTIRSRKPRSPRDQGKGTQFTARFARVIFDFVLLYLTLVTIFVNRHGPLKKFDTGRAAETLSAVNP